ncbi:hypothetical protein WSM22_21720 [Cytophagales bacterium WSM2-2]|nr:hypothetical protein WSM22_21720 [Cytophagales bacterium WSM2-2]
MSQLKIIETGDGSHSLLNETLNETYHSTHGAVQESLHVFIRNGLQFWQVRNPKKKFSILEIGFGTGLNALLTLQEAAKKNLEIEYTTIEAFPVDMAFVEQLNYAHHLRFESEKYFHELHRAEWNLPVSISANFLLKKQKGKIQDMILREKAFDIIFFDAFAPSKQPEMWEKPILEKVTKSMASKGVFVTYCAKGQLKRDLKSLGLEVESLPGPPGKREMVRGYSR